MFSFAIVCRLTDRVVRTYQWRQGPSKEDFSMEGELTALSKFEFGHQVGSFAVCLEDGQPNLLVTQSDGVLIKRLVNIIRL